MLVLVDEELEVEVEVDVDDEVEDVLEEVELVLLVVVVEEVLVVVIAFPSWSVPIIFSIPPILPKEAFTAKSTSFSFCRNLVVFLCTPPDRSLIE